MENNRESFFENVYTSNFWSGDSSRSGKGSEGNFAHEKVKLIQGIIDKLDIKSVLDIGCGDLYWMKDVLNTRSINYTGVDVVQKLLDKNKKDHPQYNFEKLDLNKKYRVDLVIVFDVFGHQLHHEVIELINYLNKLDSKYVIVTNRINKHTKEINFNKHRHEGINTEIYDEWKNKLIFKTPALYPDDYFCLYETCGGGSVSEVCSLCGTTNTFVGAKFCPECGQRIGSIV
tara:strand:- start:833 stop:1522 length:690 start_codon:yes stop_codon:yes gene_type:complete